MDSNFNIHELQQGLSTSKKNFVHRTNRSAKDDL